MTTPAAAPSAAPASSSPASSSGTSGSSPAPGGGAPATSSPPASSGAPTGSAPPSGGGQPPQPPTQPSRFKRKEVLNGREVELEASEDELWAAYRKGKAADQRFEEAARLRKEAAEREQRYQQALAAAKQGDLMALFREAGIEDPLDLMANELQRRLAEEEQLADPNVRARVEAERKLAAVEQEKQRQEMEQREAFVQAQVDAELDRIADTFDAALKGMDGIPADDDTLQIMAQLEMVNRRRGLKLTPQQLARETHERIVGRGVQRLLKLDDAKLLAAHPELAKRFQRALVADWQAKQAAKQQGAIQPPPPAQPPAPPQTERPRVLSDKEELEMVLPNRRILRTI